MHTQNLPACLANLPARCLHRAFLCPLEIAFEKVPDCLQPLPFGLLAPAHGDHLRAKFSLVDICRQARQALRQFAVRAGLAPLVAPFSWLNLPITPAVLMPPATRKMILRARRSLPALHPVRPLLLRKVHGQAELPGLHAHIHAATQTPGGHQHRQGTEHTKKQCQYYPCCHKLYLCRKSLPQAPIKVHTYIHRLSI